MQFVKPHVPTYVDLTPSNCPCGHHSDRLGKLNCAFAEPDTWMDWILGFQIAWTGWKPSQDVSNGICAQWVAVHGDGTFRTAYYTVSRIELEDLMEPVLALAAGTKSKTDSFDKLLSKVMEAHKDKL